jgi:hypothetical protein
VNTPRCAASLLHAVTNFHRRVVMLSCLCLYYSLFCRAQVLPTLVLISLAE